MSLRDSLTTLSSPGVVAGFVNVLKLLGVFATVIVACISYVNVQGLSLSRVASLVAALEAFNFTAVVSTCDAGFLMCQRCLLAVK